MSVGSGPATRAVRLECRNCGSHVLAEASARPVGQCMNCFSYDVVPLTTATIDRKAAEGLASAARLVPPSAA